MREEIIRQRAMGPFPGRPRHVVAGHGDLADSSRKSWDDGHAHIVAAGPRAPRRSDPLVGLVDADGALATVDATGTARILAAEPGTTFGFPAWSPDGSRVAAVEDRATDTSIAIFAVRPGGAAPSPSPAPVVVYRSDALPPFYLYWTPAWRRVSFLATETDGISLP